jgi:hypothetical protein
MVVVILLRGLVRSSVPGSAKRRVVRETGAVLSLTTKLVVTELRSESMTAPGGALMIFCTTCNIPFEQDSDFCSSCGGFVDYVGVREGADATARRLPFGGTGTGDQLDEAAVAAEAQAQAQEDAEDRARAAAEAEQQALADAQAQEHEEGEARARAAAAAAAEEKARSDADARTDATEKAEAEAEARSQAAAKTKAETEAAAAAKAAEASRRAAAMVAKVAAPPPRKASTPPPEPPPEEPPPTAVAPRPAFTARPAPAPSYFEATRAYEVACTKCASGNPPGRTFCRQCGARLGPEPPAVFEPPAYSTSPHRPGPAVNTPLLVKLGVIGLAVLVILAVTAVLLTRGGDVANEVVVSADAGWVDTGVTLAPGEQVTLTASGSVVTDANNHPDESFDPDGTPQTGESPGDPVQDANHAALVGRVGSEEFLVGSGPTVLEGPMSELFLRVNDDPVDDNEGEFTVTVEVSEVG